MRDLISSPWPWYVAGPLIGLIVPLLLLVGRKRFGISTSLQHACAATVPCGLEYFYRRTTNLRIVVIRKTVIKKYNLWTTSTIRLFSFFTTLVM